MKRWFEQLYNNFLGKTNSECKETTSTNDDKPVEESPKEEVLEEAAGEP